MGIVRTSSPSLYPPHYHHWSYFFVDLVPGGGDGGGELLLLDELHQSPSVEQCYRRGFSRRCWYLPGRQASV